MGKLQCEDYKGSSIQITSNCLQDENIIFKLAKHEESSKIKPKMFLCNYKKWWYVHTNTHHANDETILKVNSCEVIFIQCFFLIFGSISLKNASTSPLGNLLASFMICINFISVKCLQLNELQVLPHWLYPLCKINMKCKWIIQKLPRFSKDYSWTWYIKQT